MARDGVCCLSADEFDKDDVCVCADFLSVGGVIFSYLYFAFYLYNVFFIVYVYLGYDL